MLSDDCVFFVASAFFIIDDILNGGVARYWAAAEFGDS